MFLPKPSNGTEANIVPRRAARTTDIMRHLRPEHCIDYRLLRYVCDSRLIEEEFVEWLGPSEAARYRVLHKAGLLEVFDGRVALAAEHLSPDGRYFDYGIRRYHLDEDRIDFMARSGNEP
jgi:hypothetical protein